MTGYEFEKGTMSWALIRRRARLIAAERERAAQAHAPTPARLRDQGAGGECREPSRRSAPTAAIGDRQAAKA